MADYDLALLLRLHDRAQEEQHRPQYLQPHFLQGS